MKPYVLKDIDEEDLDIFHDICTVVGLLPDFDLAPSKNSQGRRRDLTCHVLCQALTVFFPVKCHHGYYFSPGWEHGWLTTPAGHIIDAYPWGTVGGPIMIGNHFNIPGMHLYHTADLRVTRNDQYHDDVKVVMNKIGDLLRTYKLKTANISEEP